MWTEPNVPTLYGRGTTWGRRQALGARQARATTTTILEPFMKNPAKETAEQRRAPGEQATFNGDQLETEAPTAGYNEAEVEGKKTEQEPRAHPKGHQGRRPLPLLPRAPQVQVQ